MAEDKNMTDILIEIADLAIEGLTIDGEHHKQWYFEQVLEKIFDSAVVNALRKENDWEEGVAP